MNKKNKGYTLVEILVVISIIGFLAAAAVYSVQIARLKGRDARRLLDMQQIQLALNVYHNENKFFPNHDAGGESCGGWDVGNNNYQLLTNRLTGVMNTPPNDMKATGCGGYRYYRYSAGSYGCDTSKGAYYILGVTDMETSGNPHPNSPGFSCSGRNWQGEFDWVTGKFENK